MQRSLGKRVVAVVAGVGLALSGAAIAAPAAHADGQLTYSWPTSTSGWTNYHTIGTDKWKSAQTNQGNKLAECQNQKFVCGAYTEPRVSANGDPQQRFQVRGYKPSSGGGVTDDGGLEEEALETMEAPAPPPCWDAAINNCPIGGAIQAAVPQYMIAGVPQQLVVYAAWRPDENTAGAPTNGDAVISMDGEPVAAAAFENGVATFKFTPMNPGLKDVVISGVLNSNTSGANAWIDSIAASTMILPWDPEALEEALKNKKVEVGDTYTLEEVAQAKTALGKRLEWRVAQDSSDVCAVTTTKKGEVKAKFTESGKCSIIWTDPKTDEEGKYTFKVTA